MFLGLAQFPLPDITLDDAHLALDDLFQAGPGILVIFIDPQHIAVTFKGIVLPGDGQSISLNIALGLGE